MDRHSESASWFGLLGIARHFKRGPQQTPQERLMIEEYIRKHGVTFCPPVGMPDLWRRKAGFNG